MDIRYTRGLDELCLSEWMKHPLNLECLPCTTEEEIRNYARSWMYYSSKKAGLSIVDNDRCIGMAVFILMPYAKVMHHALLQMVMNPKPECKSHQGVLLKNMQHLAKNYLQLEAIYMEYIGPKEEMQIYLQHGFKVYAEQKGYVTGSYPDKICLECVLI
jgi:hypothetical protein